LGTNWLFPRGFLWKAINLEEKLKAKADAQLIIHNTQLKQGAKRKTIYYEKMRSFGYIIIFLILQVY